MRNWKPERAHYITPEMVERTDPESSAVAWVYDMPEKNRFGAMCFSGKRQKPDSNYYYGTAAGRDAAIERHREGVRRNEAYKVERAAQIKAAKAGDKVLALNGRDYLPAPACAAWLRQCLKETFPGQKFSVTSDGSLRVKWTDGPARDLVERVARTFEGSYFDGMIDYKGSIYHSIDGQKVHFGADFVFCERELSREALDLGAAALRARYNDACAPVTIEAGNYGGLIVKTNPDFPGAIEGRFPGEFELMAPDGEDGRLRAFRPEWALELWFNTVDIVEAKPSPTLQRIRVLGSDGYGNTGLEAADGGDTCRGYPSGNRAPDVEQAPEPVALVEAPADDRPTLGEMADLFAAMSERMREAARQPEPVRVACEVIDLMPHLAERAANARRVN